MSTKSSQASTTNNETSASTATRSLEAISSARFGNHHKISNNNGSPQNERRTSQSPLTFSNMESVDEEFCESEISTKLSENSSNLTISNTNNSCPSDTNSSLSMDSGIVSRSGSGSSRNNGTINDPDCSVQNAANFCSTSDEFDDSEECSSSVSNNSVSKRSSTSSIGFAKSSLVSNKANNSSSSPSNTGVSVVASSRHATSLNGLPAANIADYLANLLKDKKTFASFPNLFIHAERLLDDEIIHVRSKLFQIHGENKEPLQLPDPDGSSIILKTERVYVPVKDHPEFNFVGRILGPRGMTAKQLEQDTGCKVMVRGKGSMRDKKKEDQNKGKLNWEHLNDDLHILLTVEDTENRAKIKLQKAVCEVKKLLQVSETGDDELKKRQLMELAIMNGTYRDSSTRGSSNINANTANAQRNATTIPTLNSSTTNLHHAMPQAATISVSNASIAASQHQTHAHTHQHLPSLPLPHNGSVASSAHSAALMQNQQQHQQYAAAAALATLQQQAAMMAAAAAASRGGRMTTAGHGHQPTLAAISGNHPQAGSGYHHPVQSAHHNPLSAMYHSAAALVPPQPTTTTAPHMNGHGHGAAESMAAHDAALAQLIYAQYLAAAQTQQDVGGAANGPAYQLITAAYNGGPAPPQQNVGGQITTGTGGVSATSIPHSTESSNSLTQGVVSDNIYHPPCSTTSRT